MPKWPLELPEEHTALEERIARALSELDAAIHTMSRYRQDTTYLTSRVSPVLHTWREQIDTLARIRDGQRREAHTRCSECGRRFEPDGSCRAGCRRTTE
jgi:hypothetical protein